MTAVIAPALSNLPALRPGEPHEYHPVSGGRTGTFSLRFETDRETIIGTTGERHALEFSVLVSAVDEQHRPAVLAFLEALRHAGREFGRLAEELRNANDSAQRADERAALAKLRADRAEQRTEAVLGGRHGLLGSGTAEVRPHDRATWTGAVWLLDPVKRWAGFGFQFNTITDLWRAHPYLRPLAAGADDDGPWMLVARHKHVAEGA